MMKRIIVLVLLVGCYCNTFARDYFVGGTGASDNNTGTSSQPFATIQKAASVAVAGDIIKIRAGTYRETIVPANSGSAGNPVIYQPDNGATVIISGNNPITTSWTVHSGNIYKTSVTLPVNGHQSRITTNTTILSNQIFDDGAMQFEARWPKISKEADLLDITKMRHISKTTSFNPTSLTDPGLVSIPGGLTGAKLVCTGWFLTNSRIITSQGGNTLNYSNIHSENFRFRKYYYVTGKLGLLTQAKEWHYESGTLYFSQEGGGSPAGVEYKARNWGFDLRGKSGVTIAGLQFFACEPMTGDTNSNNIVIDNIKAKYTNHAVMQDISVWPGYGNAQQTGIKLIGANCVIKNSEIQYVASHGIWLGENGKAENNLIQDISYEGNWGAGVSVWASTGNQLITRNTIRRTGRSCIDLGYSYTPHGVSQNLNMNIGYNDISMFGMLNIDLGGIYGWGFRNTAGSRIHHNWVHDSGVVPDPTGIPLDGIQTGTYFDQASGPFTVDHNVYWNNHHNLSQDAADHYTQPNFEHRNAGSSLVYNNTFASAGPKSYVTYVASPLDVQKNNIYNRDININWTTSNGNTTNSLLEGVNAQFVGSGQGGLFYRVKTGSPAINAGATIAGITDGSSGAPDIGAYEFGGEAWIPGYVPVSQTPGGPVTTVSISPSTVSIQVGGTNPLTKTIVPSNAVNQNVSWTTSNASVATVNSSGLVTAVAVGSATITVTTQDGSFTATSAVTVIASPPLIEIDNAVLGTGTNQHNYSGTGWVHAATEPSFLNSTLSFSNTTNNTVTLSFVGNRIEWYTEKMNHHGIAAVSIDNGPEVNVDLYAATAAQRLLVYSSPTLTPGTHSFKIRVTGTKNAASTGFYAIHDFVKVYSGDITKATAVTVSPTASTLTMGGTATVQLSKTVVPSTATNQSVSWTTSNASVASVNSSGLVTAVTPGSATITATTQDGSFTATSTITVTAGSTLADIDNAVLGTGVNQHNYSGTGWVHAATEPSFLNSTLSFSSATNNMITLSFVGNRIEWYTEKAKHLGIAAVSIDNGPEVSVDLYAVTGVQRLLVYSSPVLTQGTHSFKIRVTGTKNTASTGFYVVHDFVKVYSGNITKATAVTVSPTSSTLTIGGTATVQLTKTIVPSTATNQNVSWATSNASVASVNSSGLVTAVAAGSATITATTQDGLFTATSVITVITNSTLAGIDDAVLGAGTNQHNYSGTGWVHAATEPSFLNSTLSFSNATNNTVTLSFVGNKIEWYTEKMNHHGIAAVSIDNGPEVNVDLYAATAVQRLLVYTSATLTQGTHSFKIRVTGTKNAASTGFYAIHDFVKAYSSGGGGGGERVAAITASAEEKFTGVAAYPNPVNSGDMLHLEFSEAPGELKISDIMGKSNHTFQVTEKKVEIPTSELPHGMYLVQYRSVSGLKAIKIVVE